MSGLVSGTIFVNLTWAIPITSIQSRPHNSTNPNKNTWFNARMKTHDYPPLFAEACWGYSHIHSAPLLLRFGAGRRGQLLMGPQSSGHLSDAHCYAIYAAMFHLSWQELLTFWNVFFGELTSKAEDLQWDLCCWFMIAKLTSITRFTMVSGCISRIAKLGQITPYTCHTQSYPSISL